MRPTSCSLLVRAVKTVIRRPLPQPTERDPAALGPGACLLLPNNYPAFKFLMCLSGTERDYLHLIPVA
jgi:hypothetical protein